MILYANSKIPDPVHRLYIALSEKRDLSINGKLYRCTTPGCGYCSTDPEEIIKHKQNMIMNEEHRKCTQWVQLLGPFYGTMKYLTEKGQKIPSILEMLGETNKIVGICTTCREIVATEPQKIKRHYDVRKHAKKRGTWVDKIKIIERAIEDDGLIEQNQELLQRSRRAFDEQVDRIIRQMMQEQEYTEEDRRRDEEADRRREERWEQEQQRIREEQEARRQNVQNQQRVRNQDGQEEEEQMEEQNEMEDTEEQTREEERRRVQQRREERVQAQRYRQTIISERSRVAERLGIREEEREEIRREEAQIDKRRQARKWRAQGLEREQKGIALPKLTRETRKQIREGLKCLWRNEICRLLDEYAPRKNDEESWLDFEGALYEVEHRLRTHIMVKLGRKPESMYKKERSLRVNPEQEKRIREEGKIKRIGKIGKWIERLNTAIEEGKERKARKLVDKVEKQVSQLSEQERRKWWKTENVEDIMMEIGQQVQNAERYGEWVETVVREYVRKTQDRRNEKRNKQNLQEMYADNARKTMNNHVWRNERPLCSISMDRMEKYMEEMLKRNERIETTHQFSMKNHIRENIEQEFKEAITKEDNIRKAIESRNWITAPGIDGLDYSVYKYEEARIHHAQRKSKF